MRERSARQELEAALRVKDEFLATVSHELRTPLSAVLLWSQLIEAGSLSADRIQDAAHKITTSARTQSRLIEDLLDASRMLMGKLMLEVQPRALGAVVTPALEFVRPAADAKGVTVEVHGDGGLVVNVDTQRLQQVVWNLVSNAVKFTPAGGRVSITMAGDALDAVIVVQDTGDGIDPALLPHVFEPFRQGQSETTARRSGLGLGLSIVKHLVELHGGSVAATSAGPGTGATFTLRLPLLAAALALSAS